MSRIKEYAQNLRAGSRVVLDGGFTCIKLGSKRTILRDKNGLYFKCAKGKHYIAGQLQAQRYIGMHCVTF